uniref:Long-chain-fatty-acid--CoA ligase ACSBG1 n=1 Tax=Sphenodon punctatus TaxID=8508 RepID=A0A8D0H6A6_SPHPU
MDFEELLSHREFFVEGMPNEHFLKKNELLWTSYTDGEVKLRIDHLCSQTPITIHQIAMTSKRNGEWKNITFAEYYSLSRKAAKSFLKMGLERFHRVAILGFNSPEWFISALRCMSVFALYRGIVTGIYTTNSPEACHYTVHDCRANIIVVENQKQLDKIMQIWSLLPHLKAVMMYKDSLPEKCPNLYMMEEFMDLGNEITDAKLDEVINSQKPNQCCVLIYTSGTTGKPKGVMLIHDNVRTLEIPVWPRD